MDVAEGGARFPTEPQLAAELGVSRPLLREALSRLEHEGLLRRRRGEATSVNVAATGIRYWLDRQQTFVDLFERNGLTAVEEVLSVGFVPATPEDQAVLDVEPSRWIVVVRKRWRAGGRIVVVADNFIPTPPGTEPGDVVEPEQSMFDLVAKLHGEDPEWEIARPAAVLADDALLEHCEIPGPAAIFALRTLGIGVSGARLYRAIELYPPDAVDWAFVRTFRPG
jgi:GntR family transcriptional regulator